MTETASERLLTYLQATGNGRLAPEASIDAAAAEIQSVATAYAASNSREKRDQARNQRRAQSKRMLDLAKRMEDLATDLREGPPDWSALRLAPSPQFSKVTGAALEAKRPSEYSRPEISIEQLTLELKRRASNCRRVAAILNDLNTSSTGGSYMLARCLMIAREVTGELPPLTTAKPNENGNKGKVTLHRLHSIILDLVKEAGGNVHGAGSGPWLQAIETVSDPGRWEGFFIDELAFHKPNRKKRNNNNGDETSEK
ncbi:MAG: hypothetical protein H7124_07880 [Phycisphaerales bacterium]|nr:hypothetical protein [Hyphomonadaceae bacterium]